MGGPEWHEVEGFPSARQRGVVWSEDLGKVRPLFVAYRRWLADHRDPSSGPPPTPDEGLAIMDRLIEGLPGAYGPPRGDVLLWFDGDDIVALGALRELEPGIGEIKRIHIRSDYRGGEFGMPFVATMVERARALGYRKVRADALGSMAAAIDFYTDSGFYRIPAYWPHPAGGTIFFEHDL